MFFSGSIIAARDSGFWPVARRWGEIGIVLGEEEETMAMMPSAIAQTSATVFQP